jgi:hypothetical protein
MFSTQFHFTPEERRRRGGEKRDLLDPTSPLAPTTARPLPLNPGPCVCPSRPSHSRLTLLPHLLHASSPPLFLLPAPPRTLTSGYCVCPAPPASAHLESTALRSPAASLTLLAPSPDTASAAATSPSCSGATPPSRNSRSGQKQRRVHRALISSKLSLEQRECVELSGCNLCCGVHPKEEIYQKSWSTRSRVCARQVVNMEVWSTGGTLSKTTTADRTTGWPAFDQPPPSPRSAARDLLSADAAARVPSARRHRNRESTSSTGADSSSSEPAEMAWAATSAAACA